MPTQDKARYTRTADGWLDTETGRWLPLLAGADGDDEEESEESDEATSKDENTKDNTDEDTESDDEESDEGESQTVDDLPDWAQKIVKSARRSEKHAKREAQRLRDKGAKPDPKAKGDEDEADEEPGKVNAVTAKIRRANLKAALADAGITDRKQQRAVTRLIDVSYDADDEPLDLEDVLAEAEETYGQELVRGAKPPKRKPPRTGGSEGGRNEKGPSLTRDELQMAEMFGMTAAEYAAHKSTQPPAPKKEPEKKK